MVLRILTLIFIAVSSTARADYTIVALGDSLTDGYGVDKDKAYPDLVEKKFQDDKKPVHVLNAGISGSTSASGMSRLKWFLKRKPQGLFLALGANDGLRGVKLEATKKNLLDTIHLAKDAHVDVYLAGMRLPPNYGADYTKGFHQMFLDLARDEHVALMPFLLDGVAGKPELNQADGMHPNEKGHAIVADQVYKFLRAELVKKKAI